MLTVHHLRRSRSERVHWLCEELGLDYELRCYDRMDLTAADGTVVPLMGLAPPAYKALHPLGSAPVIEDRGLVLAESGAIVDYILARYGDGQGLALGADDPSFANYLYWLRFANDTFQAMLGRSMFLQRLRGGSGPISRHVDAQIALALGLIDRQLGEKLHIAGNDFTAADIMLVFPLTTMRYFAPFDLASRPHILTYLRRISMRDAYWRAMAKGDPDMPLLLT